MGNLFDAPSKGEQGRKAGSSTEPQSFLQWLSNHSLADYQFLRPELINVSLNDNLLSTLSTISTHGFTAVPCLDPATGEFIKLVYLEDIIAVLLYTFHTYRNNHPDYIRSLTESFHIFRETLSRTKVRDLATTDKSVVVKASSANEVSLLDAAHTFSDPHRDINRIVVVHPETGCMVTMVSNSSLMRAVYGGYLTSHPTAAVDSSIPLRNLINTLPLPQYVDANTPVYTVLDLLYKHDISAAIVLQDGIPVTQFSRSDIKLLVRPNVAFHLPAEERSGHYHVRVPGEEDEEAMFKTLTLSEKEQRIKVAMDEQMAEAGRHPTSGEVRRTEAADEFGGNLPSEPQVAAPASSNIEESSASSVGEPRSKPVVVPTSEGIKEGQYIADGYDAFLTSALASPVGRFISLVRQRQLMCSTPLASVSLDETLLDVCAKMNAMYIHQVYVKGEQGGIIGVVGIRELWSTILGRNVVRNQEVEISAAQKIERAEQKTADEGAGIA